MRPGEQDVLENAWFEEMAAGKTEAECRAEAVRWRGIARGHDLPSAADTELMTGTARVCHLREDYDIAAERIAREWEFWADRERTRRERGEDPPE